MESPNDVGSVYKVTCVIAGVAFNITLAFCVLCTGFKACDQFVAKGDADRQMKQEVKKSDTQK